MKRIVCISLLLAVGCNSASSPEYEEIPDDTKISIAGLKALCDGRSYLPVTRDATLCGSVVANDLYGEFYHEIVIQDQSGGISVALESEDLAHDFPIGKQVEVLCNGLALYDYGGKIRLGAPTQENLPAEIPADEFARFLRTPNLDLVPPLPRRISLDEVDNRLIDTRVRFDGVRFAKPGRCWCDRDSLNGRTLTTEHEILDESGNRFTVRVLWNCSYADEPTPSGAGAMIGIVDYFGGKFSLRISAYEVDFSEDGGSIGGDPAW